MSPFQIKLVLVAILLGALLFVNALDKHNVQALSARTEHLEHHTQTCHFHGLDDLLCKS